MSLTVGPETCLGVIGPNGVGKSTLLQLLGGLLVPVAGDIRLDPPTATVGYLARSTRGRGRDGARCAAAADRRGAAARRASPLQQPLSPPATRADDRYAAALGRYESLSAGDFEARFVTTLERVGLHPASANNRPTHSRAGRRPAWRSAAVLLSRFDVTLLDEPTNDLDFDGLARLEEMVARSRGGMVIVSHDRAFLDGAVTEVLELDEHTRTGRRTAAAGRLPGRAAASAGPRR